MTDADRAEDDSVKASPLADPRGRARATSIDDALDAVATARLREVL